MVDKAKRNFFRHGLLEQMGDIVDGFREGLQTGDCKSDFDRYFESYESCYALALAYPDDVLLETARMHGIHTEGRERSQIVKELFRQNGDQDYGI